MLQHHTLKRDTTKPSLNSVKSEIPVLFKEKSSTVTKSVKSVAKAGQSNI